MLAVSKRANRYLCASGPKAIGDSLWHVCVVCFNYARFIELITNDQNEPIGRYTFSLCHVGARKLGDKYAFAALFMVAIKAIRIMTALRNGRIIPLH